MSVSNITTGEVSKNIPNGEIFLSFSNPIINGHNNNTATSHTNSWMKLSLDIINTSYPYFSHKANSMFNNHYSKQKNITNNLVQNLQPTTWAPSYPIREYL